MDRQYNFRNMIILCCSVFMTFLFMFLVNTYILMCRNICNIPVQWYVYLWENLLLTHLNPSNLYHQVFFFSSSQVNCYILFCSSACRKWRPLRLLPQTMCMNEDVLSSVSLHSPFFTWYALILYVHCVQFMTCQVLRYKVMCIISRKYDSKLQCSIKPQQRPDE